MLGDRYVVVKGDNLWRVAARTLGSGKEWPRIWRYNNRREVIRVTGRGLRDPNLIRVGQVLLIPRLPTASHAPAAVDEHAGSVLPSAVEPHQLIPSHAPAASQRQATPNGLSSQTRSPLAFKFRLDDLRWPPQDVGTAIVEIRMTGDVVLMTKKAYPATFITSRGELELQMVNEANHAFGKLVSDTRFVFDPVQKRVTFRSMLVSQSTTPNMPSSAIGVEMSSNSPVPKLRAEIRLSKLEGELGLFKYFAVDAKIVIEVTPKPVLPPAPKMEPQVIRSPIPIQEEPSSNWARWIGTGLVLTAAGIVIATVVEDFLTGGVGIADDPQSAAAAGAALARGLTMLGVAGHALPKADRSANLDLKATIAVPGQVQ
jgi:hypothetical protein